MKFYLGSIDIFSGFNNGFRLPPWHHPISQIDIFRLQAVSSKLQASKKLVFYRVFGMLVISRFSKCLYFLAFPQNYLSFSCKSVNAWVAREHNSDLNSHQNDPGFNSRNSTSAVHSNQHNGLCLWVGSQSFQWLLLEPEWTRIKLKSWSYIAVFVEVIISILFLITVHVKYAVFQFIEKENTIGEVVMNYLDFL